jgi:hypothetical protein
MLDYSSITPEMAKDLPPDAWLEWVMWEPEVATPSAWPLGSNEGRCGFLEAFIWYGEEKLFEAVNHAWNSLSEPKAIKCVYIGMYAGTGGSGKWALAKMLRQALREWLDYDGHPPWEQPVTDIDQYHRAAMDFWAAEEVYHQRVIQNYADILNGEPGRHSPVRSQVIQGPWAALTDNRPC